MTLYFGKGESELVANLYDGYTIMPLFTFTYRTLLPTGQLPLLVGLLLLAISFQGRGQCFLPAITYKLDKVPGAIATGDFDSDGLTDLVVINTEDSTLSVFLATKGGFGTPTNYVVGKAPYAVAVGDFDGNGSPDLVVTNKPASNAVIDLGPRIQVLLNTGNGTFGPPRFYKYTPGFEDEYLHLVVADFNKDGKLDVVAFTGLGGGLFIFLNIGDGTFALAKPYGIAGVTSIALTTSDFNGDGWPDIAETSYYTNKVAVLLNKGDGSFGSSTLYNAGTFPTSIAAGDVNADGKPDLVETNYYTKTVSILLNKGDGTFADATNYYAGGGFPGSAIIGDFNSDGLADVAVTNNGGATVYVLLGDGKGAFASPTAFGDKGGSVLMSGDFNKDGRLDIVATSAGNTLSLFYNCPATANTPPKSSTVADQTTTVGLPFSFTIAASTDVETPYSLTYSASITPANGLVFTPTTRIIAGTPTTVGVSSVSITVTDGGGLSTTTSFAIRVTPPPAPLTLVAAASLTSLPATASTTLSVTATGGTPPYTFSFLGPGTITPAGNTATITNLPVGVQSFTIVARDASKPLSQTAATTLSLTVTPPNSPPQPTTNPSQTATVGVLFSYTVKAFTDLETPNSLTYTASINPANGLVFTPATRIITGTPTTAGVTSVTVTALDLGGLLASTSFTISVAASLTQPSQPAALTITSFTCVAANGTLTAVNFVVGRADGSFTPAVPALFIEGVTISGQLGLVYTSPVASQSALAIQDLATGLTYFSWDFRQACGVKSLLTALTQEGPVVRLGSNPIRDELVLLIDGGAGTELAVAVKDLTGRFIMRRILVGGAQRAVFDLRSQAGGVLLVEVSGGPYHQVFKVLKE